MLLCGCSVNETISTVDQSIESQSEVSINQSIEDYSSVENEVSSETFSSVEESISSVEEISSSTEIVEKPPKAKNITNYLGDDNDIFRINITTDDGSFPTNKVDYVPGFLTITQQDTQKVEFEGAKMGVRLRGNSTLEGDKKPFRIKFDKKQSLFGLPKAKSWVLLANYFDKSNVRNYLAYLLANKLDNLYFQPSSIFVDVYFNNQYQGLYMLTEQMEEKEGRVDIAGHMSEDGIDSFLLEADFRAIDEYAGKAGTCYLEMLDYKMVLKYPDCDDYLDALVDKNSTDPKVAEEANQTIEQYEKDLAWINNFLAIVRRRITSKVGYTDVIDVDSFIDYYLIEELFKNVDVGSTSQYYFVDQADETPKLKCGPVWDFDIAGGAVGLINGASPAYQSYIDSGLWVRERDSFYKNLFADDYFRFKVIDRYGKVKSILQSVCDEVDILRTYLSKAQERNLQRWPFTQKRQGWIEVYALSDEFVQISSIESHYAFLNNFLRQRFSLLNYCYGQQE